MALIAPHLPDEQQPDLLKLALDITSTLPRVKALAACAVCTQGPDRLIAVREALDATKAISHQGEYERALRRFAHLLPPETQARLRGEFNGGWAPSDAESRIRLIVEGSEDLDEPVKSALLIRALGTIQAMENKSERLRLLLWFASILPEDMPVADGW